MDKVGSCKFRKTIEYREGAVAYLMGFVPSECPYKSKKEFLLWSAWIYGWFERQEKDEREGCNV